MSIRESLRRFLHWQYTGWAVATALGVGFVMIQLHHFVLAYIFFAVAGAWAIAYWWYSDILFKKLNTVKKLEKKQKPDKQKTIVKYQQELRKHGTLKWSVISLLLLIMAGWS